VKKLFSRFLSASLEILLVAPIPFFIGALALPPPLSFWWLLTLPVYSFLGLLFRTIMPRHVIFQYLFGLPLCIAGSYSTCVLAGVQDKGIVLIAVCSILLFYRARMFVEHAWPDIFPPFITFYINILSFLLLLVIGISPKMAMYRLAFTFLGVVVIIVNLFVMNHLNLKTLTSPAGNNAKKAQLAVSKGMGSQNKLLLAVVFIVILIASSWRQMLDAIGWLFLKIWYIIDYLIGLLYPGSSESSSESGSGAMDGLPTSEAREPNPFWDKVMEIILYGVVALAVIAFVVFVLYVLYKLIKLLIKIIKRFLVLHGEYRDGHEEYKDVHESILKFSELPRKYLKQVSDWLSDLMKREPSWDSLKNGSEKIRYLYRKTLYKAIAGGYMYKPQLTPKETISDIAPAIQSEPLPLENLKTLYEGVRYGQSEPEAEDVETLKNKLS